MDIPIVQPQEDSQTCGEDGKMFKKKRVSKIKKETTDSIEVIEVIDTTIH